MAEELTRIAIVNPSLCKPQKCRQECKRICPIVRRGKLCIDVTEHSKVAIINESLCIGCGLCAKKCPFGAITIINLPKEMEKDTTHRYGQNLFKLHRLPTPRAGQVVGLVGTNGIGKSTALKILAGKQKPNLGHYEPTQKPDWDEILNHFKGSELQTYFHKLLEENLKTVVKPQYVDQIQRVITGEVDKIMRQRADRGNLDQIISDLDLGKVLNRDITCLSGGELQRFALAMVCVQEADVYMFDEPSSYLDVKQRLKAARAIRSVLSNDEKYVIVVEHDLSVLDYLSDSICVLYGVPGMPYWLLLVGAYGVVTIPFTVREGINIFLAGFVPTENLRFREVSLSFKITDTERADTTRARTYSYPKMIKKIGTFELEINEGNFSQSEIIVLLGENGTGKTTFIRLLAGIIPADNTTEALQLEISYKPQKISPRSELTVRALLYTKLGTAWQHPQFQLDVVKPMQIDTLMDQQVHHLSGGELQRVALILCLGKPSDIYLIDEPSAYLDSEQRIIASKVIKRFILHTRKTAFVVEHDFIMATYLANRVIVYEGEAGQRCIANSPELLLAGMNRFLQQLDITFRRGNAHCPDRLA